MSRLKRRQETELAMACFPIDDAMVAAKNTHAEEGSEESRAAKRDAMKTTHQTRAWLRAADDLQRLPGVIASLEQKVASARHAQDDQAAERVAKLERLLAAEVARLARIQRDFGPLVQSMQELAAGGES
ncbi:hypothetical protein AB0I81_40245 [Nonomuraea sp. NPDC050404]|uniref:hypothetical protein n=1 Tax=Nonomuraea sp. NPDC050404 TaxID=3155783 RepID=UPI0033C8BBD8